MRSVTGVHPIGRLLLDAVHGRFPAPDGGWRRVPPWRPGLYAVLAFTGHAVLVIDEAIPDDLISRLGPDGFGGATHPRLVTALAGPDGWIDSLDLVLASTGQEAPSALVPRPDLAGHPRATHARAVREDVRVWGPPRGSAGDGAVLVLARGMGGLAEVSVELPGERRSRGLGRQLLREARSLVDAGAPIVGCVAPGNAASVRAFLRAGYLPVASLQLFTRGPYVILT
jgi:hypothetical protein